MEGTQLELIRIVEKPKPKNIDFEKFLEEVRAETAEMLGIALELFPEESWQTLAQVPTDKLRDVRSEFNRKKGLPPPWWEVEGELETPVFPPSSKKQRPYKPWTHERKIRGRLKLLHERIEKKWSLIDFKQQALFEAVLDNPQYFGVCPLPGSIESSRITLPNFAKEAAIAYEAQLREIESGRLQPINIPLQIADKQKELVPLEPPVQENRYLAE